MALNKETLLKRSPIKEITLPDGETVYLKALPASFFISIGKDKIKETEADAAAMIAASLCDEDGVLFFDPKKDKADVLSLALADFGHLNREIMILNGLTKPEDQDATAAEKN